MRDPAPGDLRGQKGILPYRKEPHPWHEAFVRACKPWCDTGGSEDLLLQNQDSSAWQRLLVLIEVWADPKPSPACSTKSLVFSGHQKGT